MNSLTHVQEALACLRALDHEPATPAVLAARCAMRPSHCQRALTALEQAGLIAANAEGQWRLICPLDDIDTLALMDAVWMDARFPEPTMLYAASATAGVPIVTERAIGLIW